MTAELKSDATTPDLGVPHVVVRDLTMAFGSFVVQRDLNFSIQQGDIFIIMGDSGCGKSTLLRHLIGLRRPAAGTVLYHGQDFWASSGKERDAMLQKFGITYQAGALWSSMTLGENVVLPLMEFTSLSETAAKRLAALKLALVGLAGFEDYYPSEISGGMKKRAAIARALALDPEILFFDEPSAGLDPLTSRLLDDLILELRENLGATIVMVTHELASIFTVATNSVFLDAEQKTQVAAGDPRWLREHADVPKVRRFLNRGEEHVG